MNVKNLVVTVAPSIPRELQDRLILAATYELKENEARIFNIALNAIVDQLKSEQIDFSTLTTVNAIFTDDGYIEMGFHNESIAAVHFSLAIYAVGAWRRRDESEASMVLSFIEELCHHYWRIEDEVLVKYKITEIFNRIKPGHTVHDLFNLESLK